MKKLLTRLTLSTVLLLAFHTHISAQKDLETQLQQVDSLFSNWAKPSSPGASIGIYSEGSLIYSQGYGMSNLEYDIPIKSNSIFHVASISKQFTDFAILLLEEEGKLSIEDDIRKYMPEIHDFGKKITIRHLMYHTSGIRDQWQLLAIAGWRLDDVVTKAQIMKMILGQRELNFEPGSKYSYSNSGYSILARIVEKVSKKPFAKFASERIFKPLGMEDTHVHDDHEMIVPRRTYSYKPSGAGYKKEVLSFANDGATSLFTTAEDMGKWMNNMLHPDLGKSFVPSMRTKGKLNNGEEINYGLGQSVGIYKGLNYAGHGGSDAGFRSYVRWYPEYDFGVVVLSNLSSFDPNWKVNQITDIFLKDNFKEEEEKVVAREEVDLIELPVEKLAPFTGRYAIDKYGISINLKLEKDKLKVYMDWNGGSFTISPYTETKFIDDGDLNMRFTFKKKSGKVTGVEIQDGDEILEGIKTVKYEVNEEKLQPFLGNYYCPETDSYYKIVFTEKGLKATHNRHEDISLNQKGVLSFGGSAWWMGKIDFIEDKNGNIEGFLIGGGRVENLRFNKVD